MDWVETVREQWKVILVISGFLLLSLVALVLLYLVYLDALSGTEATAVATVLLVAITGGYGAVTYQLMRETRKARQQEIMPAFEFHSEAMSSALVNVGNGPARKLDATIALRPADETRHIRRQSVPTGEEIEITGGPFTRLSDQPYLDFQLSGLDIDWKEVEADEAFWETLEEYPYERLTVEGSCEDIWGNRIPIYEQYDVRDLTV